MPVKTPCQPYLIPMQACIKLRSCSLQNIFFPIYSKGSKYNFIKDTEMGSILLTGLLNKIYRKFECSSVKK